MVFLPFSQQLAKKYDDDLLRRITSSKSLATSFGPQNTW